MGKKKSKAFNKQNIKLQFNKQKMMTPFGKFQNTPMVQQINTNKNMPRQLVQVDMFQDTPVEDFTKDDHVVEWTTADQINPPEQPEPAETSTVEKQTDTNVKNRLLQNNVVLIGPRKLISKTQKRAIQNEQKPMQVTKYSPIKNTTKSDENPTPVVPTTEPKFELNKIPDEKAIQSEPMVSKKPEVVFNPDQPKNFEPNQAVDFNPNQPDIFNHNKTMAANQPMHSKEKNPARNISDFLSHSHPKGIPKSMLQAHEQAKYEATMQSQVHNQNKVKEFSEPNWVLNDVNCGPSSNPSTSISNPIHIDTSITSPQMQIYSPSEVYEDKQMDVSGDETSDAQLSELSTGQKRVSAFQRLGPQMQPNTPKITINLNLEKKEAVRKVVDETEKYDDSKYTPVHLRPSVINSTDETVMKYLVQWPWKKEIPCRKTVSTRSSRTVMILEQEKMEELYEKESYYFLVQVKGYPVSWTKEDVLDTVLESVKGKILIPCFIDFTKRKCSFLVIKSKPALVEIHKNAFQAQKDNVELKLYISWTYLSLSHLDFIPRLILRKHIMMAYDGEKKLDLSEFTIKEDLSHFIYFPLSRIPNQNELRDISKTLSWTCLSDLNLSRNRLTSISGFNLPTVAPNLKHLDLSHNLLNKITVLLTCRNLSLNSINLEGNPLCHDYIEADHYIKVIKMIFPCIKIIDGEKLHIPGCMPVFKKNYCRREAKFVVDTFLEVFFPLLDSEEDQRLNIENLYDPRAVMTITYNSNLRCKPVYRSFRNIFMWARVLEEGITDSLEGTTAIVKLINKWPALQHDPSNFNVDVLYHTDTVTVLRVCGVVKLTAKTLADDEHMLAFTRTFVLKTNDGAEYKICNDMVYWGEPSKDYVKNAFQACTIPSAPLSLKLDCIPDKELKEKLLKIFMKLTDSNKQISLRCLEDKNWHFKEALEYFAKLLKIDGLHTLKRK